jgi:hypothetical protein
MATNLKNLNIDQKLITVIGPRKSGRSTIIEKIQYFRPEYQRFHMWSFALQEFVNLHNMTVTEFFIKSGVGEGPGTDPDLNRILFSLYCECKRKQDTDFSLKPALEYISKKPKVLVDDVYYYNELANLIGQNTIIFYINTDRDIRIKRGMTKKMEEIDMSQHVTTIKANDVKKWKNTYIINNDKDLNHLHMKVQELVEELKL